MNEFSSKYRTQVIEIEDSSDEEPEVVFEGIGKKNGQITHDIILNGGGSSVVDESNVFKLNNNNNSTLPHDGSHKKRRFDDYGEVIR
jgi:hypothetical protein